MPGIGRGRPLIASELTIAYRVLAVLRDSTRTANADFPYLAQAARIVAENLVELDFKEPA